MYTPEQRETIAANLKRLREERKLSKAALGRLAGVSKFTIDKYESALGADMKALEKFCEFFGVDVEYLLTEH